jgi:hypothetical protein
VPDRAQLRSRFDGWLVAELYTLLLVVTLICSALRCPVVSWTLTIAA